MASCPEGSKFGCGDQTIFLPESTVADLCVSHDTGSTSAIGGGKASDGGLGDCIGYQIYTRSFNIIPPFYIPGMRGLIKNALVILAGVILSLSLLIQFLSTLHLIAPGVSEGGGVKLVVEAYDGGSRALPLYVAVIPLDSYEIAGRIYPDAPLLYEGGYYSDFQGIYIQFPVIKVDGEYIKLNYLLIASTQTGDSVLIGTTIFSLSNPGQELQEDMLNIRLDLKRYTATYIEACSQTPRREFDRLIEQGDVERLIDGGDIAGKILYKFYFYHPYMGCWVSSDYIAVSIDYEGDGEVIYRHTLTTYGQGLYAVEVISPHTRL